MPDLVPTMPSDTGGGPDVGVPAAAPDTTATSSQTDATTTPPPGDKGDAGPSGAPAQASDQSTPAPKPAPTPAPAGAAPEVQALQGKVDQLTNLLGTLLQQQRETPAPAVAAPQRDFAGEKAALDDALKTEKIDVATYSAKVSDLAMAQAVAQSQAANAQGSQDVMTQVKAELERAENAKALESLYAKYDGLRGFEASPDFARIKAENPRMHDAFSAFLVNQLEKAASDKEQAVKDAVAAKEGEMVANFKAKGHAAVLGNPGGATPADPTQAYQTKLKEASKFGGVNKLLAQKLTAMRSAGAGA